MTAAMTAADWRCIIPLLAADALLCALWVVAACMRSSQISRQTANDQGDRNAK